jgi:hypothetical protein
MSSNLPIQVSSSGGAGIGGGIGKFGQSRLTSLGSKCLHPFTTPQQQIPRPK